MMTFNRFIAWSLGVHLIIIIIGSLLSTSKKNAFVVFGAHSRYSSHTQYKSSRIVPFTGTGKHKGNSKQGKKTTKQTKHKKTHAKQAKKTARKQSQKSPKRTSKTKKKTGSAKNIKQRKKKSGVVSKERIPELDDDLTTKKPVATKQKPKKKTPPPPPQPEPDDDDEPVAEEPKPQVAKQPSPEKIDTPLSESTDDVEDETTDQNDTSSDSTNDNHEGGFSIDGVDDPEAVAHYQRYVQEEIDRVWRPPLGVKKGTVCTIAFSIDDKGNVHTCTIAKRSAVLIYDLSIMRVARELRFHSSLWGKQFKIDFCQ